jgi:hypothetical protein
MSKFEHGAGIDSKGNGLLAGNTERACLVVGILAFIGLFQLVYLHWLYPVFGYYGFDNAEPSRIYVLCAWILSAIPCLWMPIRLVRPSQLIYWVLYLVVFVPSMFVPLYMGLEDAKAILVLMLTLFAGLAIIGSIYLYPVVHLSYQGLPWSVFKILLAILSFGLILWVVVIFRGHVNFVSFWDVYDLRSAADDLMAGSLVHYSIMWLSAVIGPFFLSWGLHYRRPLAFLGGVCTELLVYTCTGAKAAVFSIVMVGLFYLTLRRGATLFGLKVTWGCVLLFLALYLVRSVDEGVFSWALSIVLMRTFGNSGLMTGWYSDFFQRNPLTHYSHITGVSWLLPYPYVNPLGIEVGSHYSGDPTLDANAHFWATDGLAAWGLTGILFVSVLCGVVFVVLDSAAARHDVRMSALLVSFVAINLANVSLFTTLLSGGLGLLILIILAMPSQVPGLGRRWCAHPFFLTD